MAIAIVLVVLTIGSVWFHFWSPWWITDLASNWKAMDDTLMITFWVTGAVFIAVNLFMAYAIVRFRHQEGRETEGFLRTGEQETRMVAYDPDDHRCRHHVGSGA